MDVANPSCFNKIFVLVAGGIDKVLANNCVVFCLLSHTTTPATTTRKRFNVDVQSIALLFGVIGIVVITVASFVVISSSTLSSKNLFDGFVLRRIVDPAVDSAVNPAVDSAFDPAIDLAFDPAVNLAFNPAVDSADA